MTASRFVFVYDATKATFSSENMTAFIKSSRYVLQWASIFPGTYLLKSRSTMQELTDSFASFVGSIDFVVYKVTSTNRKDWNGRLPVAVWKWFSFKNDDDSEVLKLK